MRVGIHQPNFIPWFPFFYKMAMCDVFIILENVQFEKNGYQNRFQYKGKWITKPVNNGVEQIKDKDYVGLPSVTSGPYKINGSVSNLNGQWIRTLKDTLNINTVLDSDYMQSSKTGTARLIELIKAVGGTIYVTNPDAKNKYLDEDMMRAVGIEIEYCKVPKNLQKSMFEIIEEYGIEGAIKQLPKYKVKINQSLQEKRTQVAHEHGTESKEYKNLCVA